MDSTRYQLLPETETISPEVADASTSPMVQRTRQGLERKLSARQVQMIAVGGAIGTGLVILL